jgi:serine/threonine-protein kinase
MPLAAKDAGLDKIGRYEVGDLVGEGAMARVYRARDPEIDRTVAIKLLKEELCVDKEYVNRFLREGKAAGAISHPNIVTIFDVGRLGDTPYITMEFLDEKSLADVLTENTKLTVKQVISIGIQLARALDHAHRRGIVHRDVKPGNILLMEKGQTVKITDFGIARLDSSDDLQKTNAGTVLGTPRYMSPEQAAGLAVDGRSDLFSLGVILYELLTGKKAFDSNNVATLVFQIMHKDPAPIRTISPEVPVGLQRIVAKLLAKRADHRFQTGGELAEAFGRELASITAQEEEASHNKFVSLRVKWATLVGSAIAIVFALSMGAVYYVETGVIRSQVLDSGAALANFVATQTAVPVLSQNWVPLELFVQDASERGSFDYLVVTDHDHIVKAATVKELVDKPYTPFSNAKLVMKSADLSASEVTLPNGKAAFLFDAPILFQKTEIGRIYLGVDRAGMDNVLRSTLLLMSNLGLLTVLSAVGMLYVFGGLLARPIRLMSKSLHDFGAGDLDRRISETRNDEIGQLFIAFNRMAEGIQARFGRRNEDEVAPLDAARANALTNSATDTEATLLTNTTQTVVPPVVEAAISRRKHPA